jgi:RimJ/RimL family protein N-acetyltransferase
MEPPVIDLDDTFVLDAWRTEDAAAHRRLGTDPDAARWFGWTVEQARAAPDSHYLDVIARFQLGWRDGSCFSLAIRRRDDGQAVGAVEVRPLPEGANVSYLVDRELRGQGLAPGAVDAILTWAAAELALPRATVRCHVDNVASRRVAEKCGFVLVARESDELGFVRHLEPAAPPPAGR